MHWRGGKRRERLLKEARLKYPQAAIEDIDARAGRGIDRKAVMSLALSEWIDSGHSVLIAGPTGAGKSWLPCALAQYACRRGRSAYCQRMLRLGEELRIRHGNGTFGKWLIQLAKTDVLLLDDWGMAALDVQARSDLLEIINDRAASKATIINQPAADRALARMGCCKRVFEQHCDRHRAHASRNGSYGTNLLASRIEVHISYKSTSAICISNAVDPVIKHHCTRLQPHTLDKARSTYCGNNNIRFTAQARKISCSRVRNSDGAVMLQ